MIIKSSEFIKSSVKPAHYPESEFPEIAFAGRSNVGKSSLINVLINRKRLVKTSSTPGRTQLINFFLINKAIMFVDLPGYGYARVPEKIRRTWGPMIETYLTGRQNLKGVVLILDLRRIPSHEDLDLIHFLGHYQIPFVIVLTKSDKLKKNKMMAQYRRIADTLGVNKAHLLLFSAKTRAGRENVWAAIDRLITGHPPLDEKT